MFAPRALLLWIPLFVLAACDESLTTGDASSDASDTGGDGDMDADVDADREGGADGDSDADADSDSDADGASDADSDGDSDADADADADDADAGDADADPDGEPDADVSPLPEVTQVVLLAGQSNMVGLGRTWELSPELAEPDTSVLIHAEGQLDAGRAGAWQPLSPHFGALDNLFGPELGFGLEIERTRPGSQWALIKHSIGGTSLHTDWNPETGPLYAAFVEHAGRALAELRADRPAEVVGMLWMQGESDAADPHAAPYEDRLRNFVHSVRADLGLHTLPVIVGLISTAPEWHRHTVIRAAQHAVADTAHQVEVVETADLGRHPDDVYHYDTAGTLALGERFAGALVPFFRESFAFPQDFSSIGAEDNWVYVERTDAGWDFMQWSGEYWYGSTDTCRVVSGFTHPDVGGAEIMWVAPASGRIVVDGQVSDHDTTCGDGVEVGAVLAGTEPLFGPVVLPGTTTDPQSFHFTREVSQYEAVSFQTFALGNPFCDTTAWSIQINIDRAD